MLSRLYLNRFFRVKIGAFFLLALLLLSQASSLNAAVISGPASWGKTKEVVEFGGTTWNGVYYNVNGLKFEALIPNYSGASLSGAFTSLRGRIEPDIGYIIELQFDAKCKVKSIKKMVKEIEDANPDHHVRIVDSKNQAIKYAIDLIPKDTNSEAFWRFIVANDRFIKMGTNDSNESRRMNFFESFSIK